MPGQEGPSETAQPKCAVAEMKNKAHLPEEKGEE